MRVCVCVYDTFNFYTYKYIFLPWIIVSVYQGGCKEKVNVLGELRYS